MTRTELHPVEALLLVALLALEAAATLLAALLALALALLPQQRPAPAAAAPAPLPPAPPAHHPLAALAEQLVATHSRRELQAISGIRTNRTKAQLAAALVAC